MAVTQTIIKNDSQRAVVHITFTIGAESSTVALADLINTANGETSSGALMVNISSIWAANSNTNISSIIITRGTSTVIYAAGMVEYPGSQHLPSINISNQNDILVTFNTRGTIMLDLRKVGGYVQPNRNVGV